MSAFRVRFAKSSPGPDRTITVEAPHAAAARAIGESQCEPGEYIPSGEKYVRLEELSLLDPSPRMPADHARNVAIGGRLRARQGNNRAGEGR